MNKLCLLLLTLALACASANASGYDDAINAALEGPEGAHAIVAKHRFEVKPPKMEDKEKSKYAIKGQLTCLGSKAANDDVIAYRIVREKGAVKSIDVQVNGGMWLPISDTVMEALGDYRKGVPMPEEKQHEVTRALEKLMDGSWQKAAEFLIAHIAVKHC